MDTYVLRARTLGRQTRRLLVALLLAAATLIAIAAGPTPKAHAGAEYFCYTLAAPSGNCFGPSRYVTWVRAYGYNWAACSNAYYGGFVDVWRCAPPGNWSNSYFDGSRLMPGVVHNNSAGNQNQLWGYQEFL